jgi:hypothetical protein
MERMTAALAEKTPLRDGVDQATAVDIGLALQGPELYEFLVGRRGWSPDRYERWLADALISQLIGLNPGAPGPGGTGR